MRNLLLAGLGLFFLVPGISSCSTIAGRVTAVEEASYDRVFAATMKAMKELQLRPMVYERDAFRTLIVGETVFGAVGQTHEVRVHLTRVDDSNTKLEMKILGRRDNQRLKAILDEIRKELGTKPSDTES